MEKKFDCRFQEGFYNNEDDNRGFLIFYNKDLTLGELQNKALAFYNSEEYKQLSLELN